MLPKKSQTPKQTVEKRSKVLLKQSSSQRVKQEAPRPHVGIQWNDVKTGFKHFKIKRWNSIGSWVFVVPRYSLNYSTYLEMIHLS